MRPRVYTIPTGTAFADALAGGLLARCNGHGDTGPELEDYLILLPNRRAVRALQEAFLRASGGRAMLLPEMRPLGEVDGDELTLQGGLAGLPDAPDLRPEIPEIRRLALLARLIMKRPTGAGPFETWGSALSLARELARLMDQVETEGIDFDRLADLAGEDYARHWQLTLQFLEIVTSAWPQILADQGLMNPAARRTALINRLAEMWRAMPPVRPVIAAGSTGSIPATRDLLKVVAGLPAGEVIVPGLDQASPDEAWQVIDETHPQYMLKALIEHIGIDRAEIGVWGDAAVDDEIIAARQPRLDLLRHALAPAPVTAGWRGLELAHLETAKSDLRCVPCPGLREEALVIALAMRRTLEVPGKTAALITPDRGLARRVRGELHRWGVEIDDSGGTPLSLSPPAVFMREIIEAVADAFHPVPLLALLKHPLCAAGMARGAFLKGVRQLEICPLRGPRPDAGIGGLNRAAQRNDVTPAARQVLAAFDTATKPLATMFDNKPVSLEHLVAAHIEVAEALATDGESAGADRLWRGDAGGQLADFIGELRNAGPDVGEIEPAQYLGLWDALMAGQTLRPKWGGHPRLHIWGTIEARMQDADLIILGGLNEGVWPPAPPDDPWMSRDMRRDFGLPSLERRIGQSAHDFVQALGAKEVLITRSDKADGAPTVPSRWLLRLEALAGPLVRGDQPWLGIAEALAHTASPRPLRPPRPTPPVEARPDELYVTHIQEWMRDPYSLYARRILGLKPLDPLDQAPGAADRGTIIHRAFELFFAHDEIDFGCLPDNALDVLLQDGERAFGETMARPAVWAFWWPRFVQIARAFIDLQARRAEEYEVLGSEIRGSHTLDGTTMPFTVKAKADRIDRARADGGLAIIDYKTGATPSGKQIRAGFAPQMPLEGVIAEAGGFEGIEAAPVHELQFWKMQGGRTPLTTAWPKSEDVAASIGAARDGLRRMVDVFAHPDTPYLSRPRPAITGYGDYDHLARIDEWTDDLADDVPSAAAGKPKPGAGS